MQIQFGEFHFDGRTYNISISGSGVLEPALSESIFYGFGNNEIYGTGYNGTTGAGTSFGDTMLCGDTSDTIYAWGGKDVVRAGGGNDVILVEGDADFLVQFSGWMKSIDGEAGDDIIWIDTSTGPYVNDVMGGEGNDIFIVTIPGLNGSSVLDGNLDGGPGHDILRLAGGGHAIWSIDGIRLFEQIDFSRSGPPGNQTLTLSGAVLGPDILVRGYDVEGARETLVFEAHADTNLSGWTFQDWGRQGEKVIIRDNGLGHSITGTSRGDEIEGRGGDDILNGGGGNDILRGGAGNDILSGGRGLDQLFGGNNRDTLIVGGNSQLGTGAVFDGGGGSDELRLTGAGLFDLRNAQIVSIETLAILDVPGSAVEVRLAASQIGSGALAANLLVKTKAGSDDHLVISLGNLNTLSLALWQFDGWTAAADNITINGSAGGDTIIGSSQRDTLLGEDGSDRLEGGGGDDMLRGGRGADTLLGGAGNDVLLGEAGNDFLDGGTGDDELRGGKGNDQLVAGPGTNLLFGEDGNDRFLIGSATQAGPGVVAAGTRFDGGQGFDSIVIGRAALQTDLRPATLVSIEEISFSGSAGGLREVMLSADQLGGGTLAGDLRVGGDLRGGGAKSIAITLPDPAEISLAAWQFANWGGGDRIVITGSGGQDKIVGSSQADEVDGGGGNDVINGGGGHDLLRGGKGNDELSGGAGNDVLEGGDGRDTLIGGAGRDTLTGGDGPDTFVYTALADSAAGAANRDTITDFLSGTDRIDLSALGSLTFIRGGPFSGAPGEVRYDAVLQRLQIDSKGSGVADFEVALPGVASVAFVDLIL